MNISGKESSSQVPLPVVLPGLTSNNQAMQIEPTNESIPLTQPIQPIQPSIPIQTIQPPSLSHSSSSRPQPQYNDVIETDQNINLISQSQLMEPYGENDDAFIPLFPQNQKYYVLKQYCLPTSEISTHLCLFPTRFCVVGCTKILTSCRKLSDVSESVYCPDLNKKNRWNIKN
jgi:hypothetical protein